MLDASLDMILSNKWITKALIRPRGCAGWSAPVLFAYLRRQGSHVEAQIMVVLQKPSIDASAPGGKVLRNIKGHIRLKGVKFAYPTRNDVTILKNFSLAVEPGQTVALVGPSGCGKSTVINLIQRFYDPEEGSVSITISFTTFVLCW